MARFKVTVWRPHWVASSYYVEAESEDAAIEDVEDSSGHVEWIEDKVGEYVGFIDTYPPTEVEPLVEAILERFERLTERRRA